MKMSKILDAVIETAHNLHEAGVMNDATMREFDALNEWQTKEIQAAIEEANQGEFASEVEVKNVFNKWIRHGTKIVD